MRIGSFAEGEETVRLEIEIFCTSCKRQVPGGILTGKRYSETAGFRDDVRRLRERYLCGTCRDKSRRHGSGRTGSDQ